MKEICIEKTLNFLKMENLSRIIFLFYNDIYIYIYVYMHSVLNYIKSNNNTRLNLFNTKISNFSKCIANYYYELISFLSYLNKYLYIQKL